jgi:uncharacterized protein
VKILTAEWQNLLLFNYSVEPGVLQSYLPAGCELDLLNGQAHLSIVPLQFRNTKVLGMNWPGLSDFSQVNLRFYVRLKGELGVCFIKEHVPSRLISTAGWLLYNDPFEFAQINTSVTLNEAFITARYHLTRGHHALTCHVRAHFKPFTPLPTSLEHHFKELKLGVGRNRLGQTFTYRVEHPAWRIYPIDDYGIEMDAAALYGRDFSFLSTATPSSVVFAEGSEAKVYYKEYKLSEGVVEAQRVGFAPF